MQRREMRDPRSHRGSFVAWLGREDIHSEGYMDPDEPEYDLVVRWDCDCDVACSYSEALVRSSVRMGQRLGLVGSGDLDVGCSSLTGPVRSSDQLGRLVGVVQAHLRARNRSLWGRSCGVVVLCFGVCLLGGLPVLIQMDGGMLRDLVSELMPLDELRIVAYPFLASVV